MIPVLNIDDIFNLSKIADGSFSFRVRYGVGIARGTWIYSPGGQDEGTWDGARKYRDVTEYTQPIQPWIIKNGQLQLDSTYPRNPRPPSGLNRYQSLPLIIPVIWRADPTAGTDAPKTNPCTEESDVLQDLDLRRRERAGLKAWLLANRPKDAHYWVEVFKLGLDNQSSPLLGWTYDRQ